MHRIAPLGLALAGATVGALALVDDAAAPPAVALLGLLALAVAGTLAPPRRLLLGMVLAAPGAALVGFGGHLDQPTWIAAAVVGAIAVAAPLVANADRRWARSRGGPLALAVSAVGLWACVPDTEEAHVLLAATLVAVAISWLTPLRALGAAGAMATTGLFVWIAALDARGRPAAFVGAVTALGLLVWEPLGAWVRSWSRWRGRGQHDRNAVLGACHVGLVAYASRVVGLEHSVGTALALAVPAALVGLVVGMLAGAPEPAAALPGSPTPGAGPRPPS